MLLLHISAVCLIVSIIFNFPTWVVATNVVALGLNIILLYSVAIQNEEDAADEDDSSSPY